MGELVQSITSLCKLLDTLINIFLKPEFFRLSKLNRLNCEEKLLFWEVLHKICCFSTTSICESDAFKCIASHLTQLGGVSAYFLPREASARQLLLCFGWLLSQGGIERIIDKLILKSPLGQEIPLEPDEVAEADDVFRPAVDTPEAAQNYASYLIGQIHHNLRAIGNYREERAKLCAKIHKLTVDVRGVSHLSVGDLRLVTSPELLPDFLTRCRPCLLVFEAYSKWQKKSHIFWKWMESILKEEEEELGSNKSFSDREVTHLHTFLKSLEDRVRQSVMSESEEITGDNSSYFQTKRFTPCSDSKVLDSLIDSLDSKIVNLTKLNERKKKELQIKLATNEKLRAYSSDINSILDQFNLNPKNKKKTESLSPIDNFKAVSLKENSNKCPVNKLVLDEDGAFSTKVVN